MDGNLNIKAKTIQLLKENIGENLSDFGLGKDFLNRTKTILNLDFIKIKKYFLKDINNEKWSSDWANICKTYLIKDLYPAFR